MRTYWFASEEVAPHLHVGTGGRVPSMFVVRYNRAFRRGFPWAMMLAVTLIVGWPAGLLLAVFFAYYYWPPRGFRKIRR